MAHASSKRVEVTSYTPSDVYHLVKFGLKNIFNDDDDDKPYKISKTELLDVESIGRTLG